MPDLKSRHIILASGSPRRRELLAGLGLEFTIDTENSFEESKDPSIPPHELPVRMSEGKSHGFHRPLEEGELLITSDTIVILDKRTIGKPHSREEAIEMLSALSGRTHEVVTAVTLRDCRHEKTFSVRTEVEFDTLSPDEIAWYVDTFKPFDKAGAYAIQEWIGYRGIKGIRGSYYNVMGLPTCRLYSELEEFCK